MGKTLSYSTRSASIRPTICGLSDEQDLAAGAVPHGNGDAVIALPGDEPVPPQILDPLAVAGLHVLGVPLDPFPRLQELALAVQEPNEPLSGHDVFHRGSAAVVHPHRLLDRKTSEQRSVSVEALDNGAAGLPDGFPGQNSSGVREPAVSADHRP